MQAPETGPLSLLGLTIPMQIAQGVGSLGAYVVLAPLFAFTWLRLGDRAPSSAGKLAIGMAVSAAASLLVLAMYSLPPTLVTVLLPTFLFTAAELCVVPIALSLLTRFAPPRLVPLIIGVWLALVAIQGLVAGRIVDSIAALGPPAAIAIAAAMSAVAGGLGWVLLRPPRTPVPDPR